MPDYIRLVSYIYNYEEGVKRNNVGYARVEARNGQCKCTLHIAAPSLNDKQLKAYLFKRHEEGIHGILLGTMQVKNGVGDFRTITDSNHIMNSPYSINDMSGIVIYFSSSKFFASEWDDIPVTKEIVAAMYDEPEKKKAIAEQAQKMEQDVGQSNNTQAEISTEDQKASVDLEKPEAAELKKDMPIPEAISTQQEEMEEKDDSDITQEMSIPEEMTTPWEKDIELEKALTDNLDSDDQDVHCESEDRKEQEKTQGSSCREEDQRQRYSFAGSKTVFEDHPLAKRIYKTFPRMYPFEDNDVAWCVRMEPQDIGLFPMEAWVLGNNSFLLHGYYSYRHLIFARINDRNGINYIIGVPGVYHNREKFMAKMFGFENFKSVKRKELRSGEFGYWYIPIILR